MKYVMTILLITPILLHATKHHVNMNNTTPFATIQSAINYASPGDTVLVHPGTYIENVLINQKSITLASLELTTRDSTYISQTIINGNQTGSCVKISNSSNVIVRGLYITNGIGSDHTNGQRLYGGGIYSSYSNISIINSKIMYNRNASGGGGISLSQSTAFLSGLNISYNQSIYGGGISVENNSYIVFDNKNYCSVYLNNAVWGCDFNVGVSCSLQIRLDRFTVPFDELDMSEYIYKEANAQYSLGYKSTVIIPQYADFYVNPNGSDSNSGLSPEQPLKTIAMALYKIKADSLHQHSIHLANGIYSYSSNCQYLPINLKSYVSIVGESEASTIIDGDNLYPAFGGYNSEKEVKIINITIQNCRVRPGIISSIIECIPRLTDAFGNFVFMNMNIENVTLKNCHPIDYMDPIMILRVGSCIGLRIRNLTIDDCTGQWCLNLHGYNIIGENIRIRNFRYAYLTENCGNAMTVVSFPENCGGTNVFTNLEITNCENNQQDWSLSTALMISGMYSNTPTENYFINATIADNVCQPTYGSAIVMMENCKATFINSVISNNFPHSVTLSNDFSNNRVRFLNTLIGQCPTGEEPIVNRNPLRNTIEWYGSNPSRFPNFATDNTEHPYSLSNGSPCIDAGVTDITDFNMPSSFQFPLLDLSGGARISGSNIDLGAYEWCGTSLPDEPTPVAEMDKMVIYPNPFNPNTTIKFSLKEKSAVEINIYNTKGQLVKKLMSEVKSAGQNQIIWNGKDDNNIPCSSGIYYCKLTINNQAQTTKMVLMK